MFGRHVGIGHLVRFNFDQSLNVEIDTEANSIAILI